MSPVANGSSNIKSNGKHSNGSLSATKQKPAELDVRDISLFYADLGISHIFSQASKLIINRAKVLKEIPEVEALQFGQVRKIVSIGSRQVSQTLTLIDYDRPYARRRLRSRHRLVCTRYTTIPTSAVGSCIFLLPILPQCIRGNEGMCVRLAA